MNKKFNIIINTLIIMLIIALVMVMMNYYADTTSGIGSSQLLVIASHKRIRMRCLEGRS